MSTSELDSYRESLPSAQDLMALAARVGLEGELSSLRLVLKLLHFARQAQNALFERMQREEGISRGRFVLLVTLRERGELTVNELSARLGVSAASTSVMLRRMSAESSPLIARSVNPGARHSFKIRLTARGEDLVDRLTAEHVKTVGELLSPLGESGQRQLLELLEKLP
ncbi:MAG TPA: MarR family transcriptional regulator [Candidatus Avisuccinivibrio pullicola]|nr:MarR family transcriptional regulator [Candidatus Avisuccinivibrio pullicola]